MTELRMSHVTQGVTGAFDQPSRKQLYFRTRPQLMEASNQRHGGLLGCWLLPTVALGVGYKHEGECHRPEAQTHLLGLKLLHAKGGTQQGPERCQKPPPWPVLDLQEHSQVLLDALCGQPPDLQMENVGVWGPPTWERGQRPQKTEDKAMEETGPQPLVYSSSSTAQASRGWPTTW